MRISSVNPPPERAQQAEPWVSVDDIAAHLGVRKDSIYRWIERRGMPATKIGKLWKLKFSEVDRWMLTRRTNGGSPAEGSPSKRAGRPSRARSAERVVLVIDDEDLVRDTIAEFLSDEGFGALLAADGAEALELLGSASPRPSLIILDLQMPNVDGHEFRERLQRDPNLSSIPVIIVTADRNASAAGGAVLHKPLDLNQLATAIERLMKEPRAESREPRAESREPRAESREPRAESREPRAESREPRAESREPRAESREPRAEIEPLHASR